MDIKKRLKEMTAAFEISKNQYDQRFGGLKIDNGKYKGKLSRCALDIRKSDDALVVSVEFTILEGKFKGFTTFNQMNLVNEWGRLHAMRFVEVSGYAFPETENIEVLEEVVKQIAQNAGTYIIEAKQNGEYINITAQSMLDEEISQDETEEVKEEPKEKPKSRSRVAVNKKQEEPEEKEEVDEPEEPEESEDKGESKYTMAQLKAMDRRALKQVINEEDIEFKVTTKHSEDDIRVAIAKSLNIPNEVEEDSIDELPSDDELKTDLLVFCKIHKVKGIDKSMNLDDMLTKLEPYKFSKDDLDKEEIKLLTMLAMSDCIED